MDCGQLFPVCSRKERDATAGILEIDDGEIG